MFLKFADYCFRNGLLLSGRRLEYVAGNNYTFESPAPLKDSSEKFSNTGRQW